MEIPLRQIDDLRTLVTEHGWTLPGSYQYLGGGGEWFEVDVVRTNGAKGRFRVKATELDDMNTGARNTVRQRIEAAVFPSAPEAHP